MAPYEWNKSLVNSGRIRAQRAKLSQSPIILLIYCTQVFLLWQKFRLWLVDDYAYICLPRSNFFPAPFFLSIVLGD